MAGVNVYVYTNNEGVTVRTLQLEAKNPEEFLVEINGVDSVLNGRTYHCVRDMEWSGEYRFLADIGGKSFNIFRVQMGSGLVLIPESSTRMYPVFYQEGARDWATVQDVMDKYKAQQSLK